MAVLVIATAQAVTNSRLGMALVYRILGACVNLFELNFGLDIHYAVITLACSKLTGAPYTLRSRLTRFRYLIPYDSI